MLVQVGGIIWVLLEPLITYLPYMSYTTIYPWQILTYLSNLELSYKLPLAYDPQLLREDLQQVLSNVKMVPHFSPDDHDGGWSAIGLIAAEGNPQKLARGGVYSKTPVLKYAPYMEYIIDNLPSNKLRVRLMRLERRKNIFWHYDAGENLDGPVVRLHIPVVTNEKVEFQISHQSVRWNPGEFWYGDFSFPHRLRNGGDEDRVHLVMDLEINDFIRKTIPEKMEEQTSRRSRLRRLTQHMCNAYTKGPVLYARRLWKKG
jgi:hypothetical protein